MIAAHYIVSKCLKHCVEQHSSQAARVYWGGLQPSSNPAIHSTRSLAVAEAARLAQKEPEFAFIVFQAVAVAQTPAPAVTFTEFKS